MLVRVNVVLNRTVVVDSDWCFDNLCSGYLLWLWRWLPHRLSKRQSLSTTTVLFRTTFTRTIILNLLMKWLPGSKLSKCYFVLFNELSNETIDSNSRLLCPTCGWKMYLSISLLPQRKLRHYWLTSIDLRLAGEWRLQYWYWFRS